MISAENYLCFEPTWGSRPARSRVRPFGRKTHKKLRSRSSPVRLAAPAASILKQRPRSPSASPLRLSPSRPPSPYSSCFHLFKQSEVASYKSAYFSKRPPSEPMQLVVLDGTGQNITALPLGPYQSPASVLLNTPTEPNGQAKVTRKHVQHWIQPCGSDASCQIARRLLDDLTEHLPLGSEGLFTFQTDLVISEQADGNVDITSSVGGRTTILTPRKESLESEYDVATAATVDPDEHLISATVPSVGVTSPAEVTLSGDSNNVDLTTSTIVSGDCRNVAVQAPTHHGRSKRDTISKTPREAQATSDVSSVNGWIGDVRALRDSHVRLVRRQLRHIARLNRTLDHARNCAESEAALPSSPVPKRGSPRIIQ